VEETITSGARYGGYFAITTSSPNRSMQVLPAQKNKKWYNYDAVEHNFVFYLKGAISALSSGTSSISLALPIHVVLDPTRQKTYMYSATSGSILNAYSNPGDRPFTYKKYVPDKYYNFRDLTASIIATGNVAKVTDSPSSIPGKFSVLFNGVTSYLEIPSTYSYAINFGPDSFTFECWFSTKSLPSGDLTLGASFNSLIAQNLAVLFNGSLFIVGFGSTKVFVVISSVTVGIVNHGLTLNTWTHLAVVRKNSSLMIFINGQEVFSNYFAPTNTVAMYNITVGSYVKTTGFFKGNIANLLLVKDALYAPSYTVPGGSYSSAPGTIFQLDVDPTGRTGSTFEEAVSGQTFTDIKNIYIPLSSYTLPRGSDAFQPFTPNVTLGTSIVTVGEGSLEGTGLSGPGSIGQGDFTIEAWVYPTSSNGRQSFMGSVDLFAYNQPQGAIFSFEVNSPTRVIFRFNHWEQFSPPTSSNIWTELTGIVNGSTVGLYQW
jgi:hypothetical protein